MPASVERALQLEELTFAMRGLINATYERVPKTKLRVLVAAAEPRKLTPPPKPRKRRGKRSLKNWLSAKYLPVPVASLQVDELEQPATWQQLASRIGVDEAQRLHQRLAQRRPRGPGRPADDGEGPPLAKVTDPI